MRCNTLNAMTVVAIWTRAAGTACVCSNLRMSGNLFYLDIQNTVYHETDVVFGNGTLIWYGDCHLLEGMNICYSVNL